MRHTNRNMHRFIFLIGVLALLLTIGTAEPGYSQEKTITLATMNWEPEYGESLPEGGFFTALTREAFGRAGYRFDVKFVPWKRAFELAKNGDYDGLMGAVMSSEREPYFTATKEIVPYEDLLFSRADETITYTEFKDLKPYIVGIIRGTVNEKPLRAAGVTVDAVSRFEQNLFRLMIKRIDLMQADRFVMSNLLKQYPEYQGKVKTVSPPLLSTTLHNLISKKARPDHAAVVADFNRGLQEMLDDGTFEAIIVKFGFSDLL